MLALVTCALLSLRQALTCYAAMTCTVACRSGKDKSLHDLVSLEILPQLVESAAARRRAEEKQAAIEAMPKKRSSRLQVHHISLGARLKSHLTCDWHVKGGKGVTSRELRCSHCCNWVMFSMTVAQNVTLHLHMPGSDLIPHIDHLLDSVRSIPEKINPPVL